MARQAGLAAALFLLALLVYVPSYSSGYVWDDDTFLTANPLIHAADGLSRFWFSTEPPDYWPLTSTLLWFEWRWWGGDATGFHVVNALLHAASCVFLWRVLRRLAVPGAWLGAALFAVHPVNVESVTWITQRKSTLPMFFFLLAAWAWVAFEDEPEDSRRRRRLYAGALVAFLLGLLAKTSIVMFPVLLLLFAWWRRGRVDGADLRRALPFFAVAVALGLVTVWYQGHDAIQEEVVRDDGILSRVLTSSRVTWFYLGKALLPLNLSFVYPRWSLDELGASSWLPTLALAAAAGVLWVLRSRIGRAPLFALAWYVACLAPVMGLLDIYYMRFSLVADHYQYFALIAVPVLAAALLARAPENVARGAGAVLVGLLAVLTWNRQGAYADEETLWLDTLERNPDAWIAHTNLAARAFERGDLEAALHHNRAALAIEPELYETLYNYAVLLESQGNVDEAIEHHARALEVRPDHYPAAHNLGFLLRSKGEAERARTAFERGLQGTAFDARLLLGIGLTHVDEGDDDTAREYFERAQAVDPTFFGPWLEQGKLEERAGELVEAGRLLRQAAQLHPDGATREALNRRANELSSRKAMQRLLDSGIPDYE